MGKKSKLGKRRRDKFYHLAKETGYRARSAFKLIQLNRKFQFLQQSKVLIDLCAAPGGWLQVASNYMPISSIVIGIDLVNIKPIHNVITIQADITTPKCRQLLQRELKTWKVDCVLNDGAPNVGVAWIQDAFSQAQLALSALKLATEFLKPGGWFVTKVFRSKDYQPLLNVFQQLFKKVHATKPQASRIESAEIFVVCQGYKYTKKPDQQLLDPKYVFEEQEPANKPEISLQKLHKPRKSAEGYTEGQNVLYQSSSVLDFVTSDEQMSILASVHKLEFDKTSQVFYKHPLTTDEIKQHCEDIKVLGLRELKQLLKWREKMRQFLDEAGGSEDEMIVSGNEDEEDMNLQEVDKQVKELEKEEKSEIKRLLRHQRKQKKKSQERIEAQKETHKEIAELVSGQGKTFSLKSIENSQQLEMMNEEELISESEEEEEPLLIDRTWSEDKEEDEEEEDEEEGREEVEEVGEDEEELEWESNDDTEEEDKEESNPLLVHLEEESNRRSRLVKQWFNNPAFSGLNIEEDEEEEMERALKKYRQIKNTKEDGKADNTMKSQSSDVQNEVNEDSSNNETSDDESDTGESDDGDYNKFQKQGSGIGDEFEVVPLEEEQPAKIRALDPAGLAIGAVMVQSRKKRLELIESGYNRWVHNDENLPDWFCDDENRHCQKQLPVTKEMVEEYKQKLKEINARPIKKIAEAKARKKNRAMKKLQGVRKKAEVICDTVDVTDHEKAQHIKSIYKKAGLLSRKKQDVQYVVAKKGFGRRVRRPAGVSGKFKVVDPRMKKDNRKLKNEKKKNMKKSKRYK